MRSFLCPDFIGIEICAARKAILPQNKNNTPEPLESRASGLLFPVTLKWHTAYLSEFPPTMSGGRRAFGPEQVEAAKQREQAEKGRKRPRKPFGRDGR